MLASLIGVRVPAETQILYGETDTSNPFVPEEQMMPFIPFVRVRDAMTAIEAGPGVRARLQAHEPHSLSQRPHDDHHGPADGHHAIHQEWPVHGGAWTRGRGLSLVQHRDTDG